MLSHWMSVALPHVKKPTKQEMFRATDTLMRLSMTAVVLDTMRMAGLKNKLEGEGLESIGRKRHRPFFKGGSAA